MDLFTMHFWQLPTPLQLEAIVILFEIRKFIKLKFSGIGDGIGIFFTILFEAKPIISMTAIIGHTKF
jgi:hypothetical protein